MFRRFSLRPASGLFLRLSVIMLLLSGCATVRDETAQTWPDDIPPQAFFVEAYEADPENQEFQTQEKYLYWVRAFYEGTTIYPRGWHDLTDGIMEQTTDPERAAELEEELYLLGRNIATEWSKSNRVNLIKSGNLAVWGSQLNAPARKATSRRLSPKSPPMWKSYLPRNSIRARSPPVATTSKTQTTFLPSDRSA